MSSSTLAHVGKALRSQTAQRLWASRDLILSAAQRRKLGQVRVFGSVARGDEGADSDLDLLVCPADDASLFDVAGFMADVEELLGVKVDVVSDRGRGPAMDRIRAEAVPL